MVVGKVRKKGSGKGRGGRVCKGIRGDEAG